MITAFESVNNGILTLVNQWEPRLATLPDQVIGRQKNSQGQTIRQIHTLIDPASNNTHRILHRKEIEDLINLS